MKVNHELQLPSRDMTALIHSFDRTGENWQAMATEESELSQALQQRDAEVAASIRDVLGTTNSILALLRSKLSVSDGGTELLDLLAEELAILVSVTKDALSSTAAHLQHERSILTAGYSRILGSAAQRCVAQQQAMQMLRATAASQHASLEERSRKLSQVMMVNGLLRTELEETKKDRARTAEERDEYLRQKDEAELKCKRYMEQRNQLGDFALTVKEGLNTLKKSSVVE